MHCKLNQFRGQSFRKKTVVLEKLQHEKDVTSNLVNKDECSQGIVSDMGDINFADLGDFHSIERSQILDSSSGDNSLIENQMDLLTFLVNYTLTL